MNNPRRILSLLLVLAVGLAQVPVKAVPAAEPVIATDPEQRIQMQKWVRDQEDGTYTLTIEAYVLGSAGKDGQAYGQDDFDAGVGEDTVLRTTLSDAFALYGAGPEHTAPESITLLECTASGSGAQPVWTEGSVSCATAVQDGKTVCITGFDYSANAVAKTGAGWSGKKLIVQLILAPDPAASWQAGTHLYDTNRTEGDSTGLYDPQGTALQVLESSPQAPVTAYPVSYNWTNAPAGENAPQLPPDTIAVPGVSIHIVDSDYPAGTTVCDYNQQGRIVGVWVFSGWNRTGDFVMPEEPVTITGSWTYCEAKTYGVHYCLVGTQQPDGDWEMPADSGRYLVGEPVPVEAVPETVETKAGYYTFNGWYLDEAMTIAAGPAVTMPDGDLKLYGSWRYVQTQTPVTSLCFASVDRFGFPLNGARFGLYADPGCETLVDTAVSLRQSNGMQIQSGVVCFSKIPVEDATYYVKEICAPFGYSTSQDIYEVRVRAQDAQTADIRVRLLGAKSWMTMAQLRIVNMPVEPETGSVRISNRVSGQVHAVGGKEFVFNLYDAWGELAGATQMLAGQSKVLDLEPGVYTVTEVNPQLSGYHVETYINGSQEPGVSIQVRVEKEETIELTYENVYSPALELNTQDHIAYIAGYPDGTIRPDQAVTRAEVASIFYRMLTPQAREFYYSVSNGFSDVEDGDWFNTAVSTLSNAGVLTGYADGSFRPDRSITRAELVTIAISFFDFAEGNEKDEEPFADVAGHWADAAIHFAAQLGIVSGYGDGTFAPDKMITRAEAIAIVNRVLERNPHDGHLHPQMIVWRDNPPGTWYYAQIQEATNSHTYDWIIESGARCEAWETLLPAPDWKTYNAIG